MGMADTSKINEFLEKQHRQFDMLNRTHRRRLLRKFNDHWVQAHALVKDNMGWDEPKVRMWLSTRNSMLGNMSPEFLISMGRGQKLVNWIRQQIDENKPPDTTPTPKDTDAEQ